MKIRKIFPKNLVLMVVFCAGLLLSWGIEAEAAQVLSNPSFETDANTNEIPDDWETVIYLEDETLPDSETWERETQSQDAENALSPKDGSYLGEFYYTTTEGTGSDHWKGIAAEQTSAVEGWAVDNTTINSLQWWRGYTYKYRFTDTYLNYGGLLMEVEFTHDSTTYKLRYLHSIMGTAPSDSTTVKYMELETDITEDAWNTTEMSRNIGADIVTEFGDTIGATYTITAVRPGCLIHQKADQLQSRLRFQWDNVRLQKETNQAPNAPASPLCEGGTNPTKVTNLKPKFSWTFDDPNTYDTQSAYQIIVGTSPGGSDMWNPGKVSSSNEYITYNGSTLSWNTTYYWEVKTWDSFNVDGDYCDAQNFTMLQSTDAMLTYYDSGAGTIPKYRTWNGGWSIEKDAKTVDGNDNWHILRSSPTSDEKILGVLDSITGDVSVLVWNGSSWGDPTEITTYNSYVQCKRFDIAYEQSSGDALVVYTKGTYSSYPTPYYRVWNEAAWSVENPVATIGTAVVQWIRLASKPEADEIVLVTQDANEDIYAQVWSGSSWGNGIPLETATQHDNMQCFDVAYEQTSGEALVVWAESANTKPQYAYWNGTSSSWTPTDPINNPLEAGDRGANIHWVKMAPKPGSNEIMMATLDAENDINAEIWNGDASSWGNLQEVEDSALGYTKRYFDVAYEAYSKKGIIVWSDNTAVPKYLTWSGSAWGSEGNAEDVGGTVHWVTLAPDPDLASKHIDDIMLMTSDAEAAPDINVQKWSGDAWSGLEEVETESSSTYECFAITYNQRIPKPTVSINSASQKRDGSGKVDISIEVDDPNDKDCKAKVEYSDSESGTYYPCTLDEDVGASADYEDSGGSPSVGSGTWQVGAVADRRIITSSGSNTVEFDWKSKENLASADGTYWIKITVNNDDQDSFITTTSLTLDNKDPVGLANFAESSIVSSTSGTITWDWTAVTTETNWTADGGAHYEIWYGTNESDVENRTDTAMEWDNDNDKDLASIAAATTTISGLSSGATYYAKIWAIDDYGNEATSGPASAATAGAKKAEDRSSLDKWGCFIASAAFGDYTKPHELVQTSGMQNNTRNYTNYSEGIGEWGKGGIGESHRFTVSPCHPVNVLRDFRDQHLLTNPLGRAFVSAYYEISPPIARFISDKEPLKAIVRVYLRPIVWGAERMTR